MLLSREGSTFSFSLIIARLTRVRALQVFVCRSGSAADTQAITAYVQYYLHQHQMELNDVILVKTAASFATRMVYSNKAGPAVLAIMTSVSTSGYPWDIVTLFEALVTPQPRHQIEGQ